MPIHSVLVGRASRLSPRFSSFVLGSLVLGSLAALGCGSSSGTPTNSDCTGTVPKYSQLVTTALGKCTNCHASTLKGDARMAATDNVDYDTYAAAKANASTGASQVQQGLMPFVTAPKFTAQEKTDFLKWATCGTPQ
jgi:uncharacterized membrane protein